jgi:dihydropteroate synthase
MVGILNLTPDSFSDGGQYFDLNQAIEHFHKMVSEGASIIDIGGESTRPGHVPISVEEEIKRVLPFIEKIREETDCLISVDTSKSEVAEASLKAGADIINDIWGAQGDPVMASIIAKYDAACILMHNNEHKVNEEGQLIQDVKRFLKHSLDIVQKAGVNPESICFDPGLGFGKSYEDNWEIMRNLDAFNVLNKPLLLGASRKSMIAKLLNLEDPKDRLSGTLATTALAAIHNVDFVRVHDVLENNQCAKVINHCTHYEKN